MATVACKLPAGLVVDHADIQVRLNGSHSDGAVGGYGMTRDVDPDWFNDWATGPAKDFPPVAQGLIFLAPNDQNAADQAKDQATDPSIKTGLEGLNPDKPAPGIEPTDDTKRELAKNAGKS